MKIRVWILPVVLCALFAQQALAQSDDWGVVEQLKQGQPVKITTLNGKSHAGAVQSVTDHSIQLENNFSAGRQDVRRVQIRSGGHRGRNAAIGAAIGAGAGAGIGASLHSYGENKVIGIGAAGFAGVGLLIGLAVPSHGYHEVYRRKEQTE